MKIRYSTRLVFIFKTFVIKIPISKRGYLQCKNEKKLYDKYKHLNLLGELYWEHYGIISMKRYNTVDLIEDNIVYDTKDKISELNIVRCDLFNPMNWGIDNNKYILIDYGINEDISKMY